MAAVLSAAAVVGNFLGMAEPMRRQKSVRKDNSMTSRLAVFLAFGTATSTSLVVAQDRPKPDPPVAVSTPPPAEFAPMTRSERFTNYLVGIAGPQSILRAAASAGISQATNTPKEWGGGAQAYGERVGSAFAQHVIRGTLQYGASAALHEDNRYFVSGQTGFFRRTKYAIASTLLALHDNGNRACAFSHVASAAVAAFISREWQPRSTTGAGDGAVSFGINMGA